VANASRRRLQTAFHSTGFSRIDQYPSTLWRNADLLEKQRIAVKIELSRWPPVATAFVWLVFFGYTSETRRLYGPVIGRIWELTPFAARRSALEPISFGFSAAHPQHRPGGISDLSGFSTNRDDESIQAPTVAAMAAPALPDVESQVESG